MINAIFLNLTILFTLLPVCSPKINTFNAELATYSPISCSKHSIHCTHQEDALIEFGANMGKYIKEKTILDADYRIKTVVIDAGHGGRDHGCSGKSSIEKKLTLKISKKLGKLIRTKYPNTKVIFTRDKDVFVPLHKRASLANKHKADLFISIHCNSIRNAAHIRGSETYVMGLHTAGENLEVAKRENEAILLEDDYESNYDGYDPNSPEGHIILSMFQNASISQSILFAEKIEKNIKYNTPHKSRGVKQAGFVVLRKTTMPSVLVETGYLSNSKDEAYLLTDKGQYKIANAIFRAFGDYKKEMESEATTALKASTKASTKKYTPKSGKTANKDIYFTIQLASSTQSMDMNNKTWQQLNQAIFYKKDNRTYKYLAGKFNSFQLALKGQNQARQLGIKGAFVVAYKGGERINVSEAKRLLNE